MNRRDQAAPHRDLSASHHHLQWALSGPGHAVQFYEDEAYLRAVVVDYLTDGLNCGQSVVSFATRAHGQLLAEGLAARGFDVGALEASHQLSLVDARDVLDRIMLGQEPDPERFRAVVGGFIDAAGGRRRVVRVSGELVDVLWKEGNTSAALRLEQLWNVLGAGHHFALLCSYSIDNFMSANHVAAFEDVCGQHHRVIPTDRRAVAASQSAPKQ